MAETFEQYIARIDSYVRAREPRAILRKTPAALARRIAGVPRRRLARRPRPGKWSILEILAHFSEIEMLWGCRMRLILSDNGVAIVGMDEKRWARNARYGQIDPRRALETFGALRRANLELLSRIPRRALSRWGAHSQFGRMTIGRIVKFLAGHDVNHTMQIDAILAKGKARRR